MVKLGNGLTVRVESSVHRASEQRTCLAVRMIHRKVPYLSGPSPKGLFTKEPIGCNIRISFGPVKPRKEDEMYSLTFSGEKFLKTTTLAVVANHACCGKFRGSELIKVFSGGQDRYVLRLNRAIKTEEEIAYTYRLRYAGRACCTVIIQGVKICKERKQV